MKVFLSFSGERSRAVAEAFRDWLRPVIQAVDPYISSRDIDKGARWAEEITQQLEASHFGIIFVTSDNLDAKWLHFEAGALSKSLERGRVAPFLFGVEQEQLHGPLTMFQSTRNTAEDIRALVQTVNSFSEQPLAETDLSQIFNVWWPQLQENLERIARNADLQPQGPAPRVDPREVMSEILEMTRTNQRVLSDLLVSQRMLEEELRRGSPAADGLASGSKSKVLANGDVLANWLRSKQASSTLSHRSINALNLFLEEKRKEAPNLLMGPIEITYSNGELRSVRPFSALRETQFGL